MRHICSPAPLEQVRGRVARRGHAASLRSPITTTTTTTTTTTRCASGLVGEVEWRLLELLQAQAARQERLRLRAVMG